MNRQPYGRPPQWWAPNLTPWWVRLSRRFRRRQLTGKQALAEVDCRGFDRVKAAVVAGQGVLITPNHSAHYDSAALYLGADAVDLPLYFMTAWQVFAMSSRFECWAMQRLGCFSIDRESTDRQAYKQGVEILRGRPYPLVIFPEGDIYHTTDRVTPFREGAAAIALSAAKKSDRPISIFPCGVKFHYVDDPTERLHELLDRLEARLYLRPWAGAALADRIHRIAEAALALKELDYLGCTASGRLRDRVRALQETVLTQLEERHALAEHNGRTAPERVKAVRQQLIAKLEDDAVRRGGAEVYRRLQQDMEDVFFVMQCYSYPGDYLAESPSIERLAETADKFEEDVLGRDLPSVRGRRRVKIRFGEPIEIDADQRGRDRVAELTAQMQQAVQQIVDDINAGE